jgi:DNA polymerase III gamma/tau subunit
MFLETLCERFRDLMILAACGNETKLVDLADVTRQQESTRAAKFDAAQLSHIISICDAVGRMVRNSASPRALIEATLVRLAMSEKFADAATVALAGGGGSGAERGTPAKKR